jgi:peptidoglycan hydrolase-like protein with peptidoglycan-binding domain
MNTSIPVTGFYGPQTMAAVKKFQTSRGIKATGKQYRLTTDALNKAACSPSVAAVSSTSEFIEIGARGEVVSMIQQQLTAAGHPVPVTGYFGPVTEYAVGMYQKKQGLKITGIVGPITKARLAGETGSTLSTTTKVVAAKISESSPTVNVGDTKKMEASATEAAQAATPAQGMFTGITPWLLLALAALFAYLFGPWSERNLDAKKDTSAK